MMVMSVDVRVSLVLRVVVVGPFSGPVREDDLDLGRRQRGPCDSMRPDGDPREPKAAGHPLQPCRRSAGVDQGAEQHVTADAGDRVEEGETSC